MNVGKITIGRVHKNLPDAVNIVVDRTSVLGNKNYLRNESERDYVCCKYEVDLIDEIEQKNEAIISELSRMRDLIDAGRNVNLQCWCFPKRCHAESIKMIVETAFK